MKRTGREIRIGILGGSFDPVHQGHLALAEAARKCLKLDKVIFVPTYISPFKRYRKVTRPRDRFKMVQLAVKKFPWADASAHELKRRGISYTIHSVRHFRKQFGINAHFFIIVGSDTFKLFPKWKSAKKILKLAQLAVAWRPAQEGPLPSLSHVRIPMKKNPASSSDIRRKLVQGNWNYVKKWLPASVSGYILRNQLYFHNCLTSQ